MKKLQQFSVFVDRQKWTFSTQKSECRLKYDVPCLWPEFVLVGRTAWCNATWRVCYRTLGLAEVTWQTCLESATEFSDIGEE